MAGIENHVDESTGILTAHLCGGGHWWIRFRRPDRRIVLLCNGEFQKSKKGK